MSAEPLQELLFDPERYAAGHPDVILRLPTGSTKAFWLAQTLGTFLTLDGSTKAPSSVKDVAGTLVTGRRLRLVLNQLHIGARRWQELVADWELRYIAHRCGPGTVFLFAHALLSECPECHCWIEVTEPAPASSKARGPGFAMRRNPAHDAKEPRALGAETLRFSGTNPQHQ
jgi:hypothetical protein